jgi:hypothetical protein
MRILRGRLALAIFMGGTGLDGGEIFGGEEDCGDVGGRWAGRFLGFWERAIVVVEGGRVRDLRGRGDANEPLSRG